MAFREKSICDISEQNLIAIYFYFLNKKINRI